MKKIVGLWELTWGIEIITDSLQQFKTMAMWKP